MTFFQFVWLFSSIGQIKFDRVRWVSYLTLIDDICIYREYNNNGLVPTYLYKFVDNSDAWPDRLATYLSILLPAR